MMVNTLMMTEWINLIMVELMIFIYGGYILQKNTIYEKDYIKTSFMGTLFYCYIVVYKKKIFFFHY